MADDLEPAKKKKKRADLDGWCSSTVNDRIKHMSKGPLLGSWRRDVQIHNVHHKISTIKWTHKPTKKMFTFDTPVPVGMEELLKKLETAQNRNYDAISLAVRQKFDMTEKGYKSQDYEVNVSFSSARYDDFRLLYCHLCTSNANLKEKFWDRYPDKSPKDNISKLELMKSWDSLGLSWNSQDILGCILPNDPRHFAIINARRFILRPTEHWHSVHKSGEKKKPQKSQIKINFSPSTTKTTKVAATSSSSSSSFAMKTGHRHSQLRQPTIGSLIVSQIDLKVSVKDLNLTPKRCGQFIMLVNIKCVLLL